MKGLVIVSKFWTGFFSAHRAEAVTIFPFIFVRSRQLQQDSVLLNHERIHLAQALELLVIPFYIWYVLEFLWHYLQYRNFDKAYRQIRFEREAYHHEKNLNYLQRRKRWAVFRRSRP